MNSRRTAGPTAVALGTVLVACTSLVAPEEVGTGADPTASSRDGEAVVRQWIEAVNDRDRQAALALMAEELSLDQTTVAADEAIGRVLDTWCPIQVDSVDATGSAFTVRATFGEDPDGSCSEGAPGTSSAFVVEVDDGEITRIP